MESISKYEKAWIDVSDLVDIQFNSLGLNTILSMDLCRGNTILDIGCGTGETLIQLSKIVGGIGHVMGVDISRHFLERAALKSKLIPQIDLLKADAQTLDLPDESVDAIFSRFGVMAINDPVVAFRNFLRILKPSGKFSFCCWRSLKENELDHYPLKVADLNIEADPTPFKFSNQNYIGEVLVNAGFHEIEIIKYDEPVSCGGVDETLKVLLEVGALGKMMRDNPLLRSKVEPELRNVLENRQDREKIYLNAAIWIVSGRKPHE